MQTSITEQFLATKAGREAENILRACVHCGFCTATCPTYQLLGDELDGPRGRIYLIKQLLEGQPVTRVTQQHLDRCLTCRACETTCPSGVQYGRLVDIGRELVEQRVDRPVGQKLQRLVLRKLLPYPGRFSVLLNMAQLVKPLLPEALKNKLPVKQTPTQRAVNQHTRKMLILEGCAQSVTTPNTNEAVSRVLDQLGISLISPAGQGCCGAVSQHLAASAEAREFIKTNIDVWWPHIENGAEAIIITASGCGVQVKDYGHLLADDPQYAKKARTVSELCRDISEVLAAEDLSVLKVKAGRRVAFHSPCTLQHGQQLNGQVESILQQLGFKLTEVPDSHLCCGSAGTYSILQPELSQQLLNNKLQALNTEQPDIIVTANIGCQLHLNTKSQKPVKHWIELLDPAALL